MEEQTQINADELMDALLARADAEVPEPEADELAYEDKEPESDGSEDESEEPIVEFDGKQFTRQELAELVEKGLDYTKKTQQLAEERRRLRELEELYEVYSSLDEAARQRVVETLSQTASPAQETSLSEQLRAAGYDEDYVAAIEALEGTNRGLRQKVDEMERLLKTVLPEVQQIVSEVRGDVEAKEASARIKAELGIDVPPEELRRAQQETGLQDLEAAWLKVNKARLVAGAFEAGHRQGRKTRPVSPGGESRQPDISSMTADEIFQAINSGMIGPG